MGGRWGGRGKGDAAEAITAYVMYLDCHMEAGEARLPSARDVDCQLVPEPAAISDEGDIQDCCFGNIPAQAIAKETRQQHFQSTTKMGANNPVRITIRTNHYLVPKANPHPPSSTAS